MIFQSDAATALIIKPLLPILTCVLRQAVAQSPEIAPAQPILNTATIIQGWFELSNI